MVFVCPPKEESEAITQMAAKVKEALHQLDNQLSINVKPICVPCCVPLCDSPSPENQKEHFQKEFAPPPVMVCYRQIHKKRKSKQNGNGHEEGVIRLHQSKSRELRASILYTGCQCEKRDGLQDDCPRTGCHGSPECMTSPPSCGPSEFCNGKHLGKKNKYNYLHKEERELKDENGDFNGNGHHSIQYKCFPATVDQPIVIPCPPCVPCPPSS